MEIRQAPPMLFVDLVKHPMHDVTGAAGAEGIAFAGTVRGHGAAPVKSEAVTDEISRAEDGAAQISQTRLEGMHVRAVGKVVEESRHGGGTLSLRNGTDRC
jgi:hypothetical protein